MDNLTTKQLIAVLLSGNTATCDRLEQWRKVVYNTTLWAIIICAINVFLFTFPAVTNSCGALIQVVDYVIIVFFVIEVSLRIWTCGELDSKYAGAMGKVRYCLSSYGFIDFIATYPAVLALVVPIPYLLLQMLRLLRLLRLFRYLQAFHFLCEAVKKCRPQMWVSAQVLVVVTFILSVVLYFVEYDAQPEVYSDGFKSVLWAFTRYIGDPGKFVNYAPITFTGRLIACIIGLLGIALFAVPAGLIGSAFREVIAAKFTKEKNARNAASILSKFQRAQDRDTKRRYVRPFRTISALQAKCQLSEQDIIDSVHSAKGLRLCDLADTYPLGSNAQGQLVVECFSQNTEYGNCIDRGSNITIVVTGGATEPCMGWFGWHLAKYGGFNYVSKEVEADGESFYSGIPEKVDDRSELMQQYISDIDRLTAQATGKPWVIFLLATCGADTPERPTQIHFTYGNKKGDNSYDNPDVSFKDAVAFDAMFHGVDDMLCDDFDLNADRHEFYSRSAHCVTNALAGRPDAFTIRVAWSVAIRDDRRISIISRLAEQLHQHLDPQAQLPSEDSLKEKGAGY